MATSAMSSPDKRPRPSGVAAAVASQGLSLPDALQAAIGALRAEDLERADTLFEAVLAHWPEQPDALHFMGVLRHAQGRRDEAVALIQRAIVAMPGEPGPWNNLGNVLVGAQRFDEAATAYERSAALAGEQPAACDALNNLGTIHRKQGRLEAAEAACRHAVALRPDFADAWYNLSQALMAQGRIHDGLLANSKAVSLWPTHLQARNQVLRALLVLGERDRAAQMYREWLAEEPDNPVVQHQLAACVGENAPDRASDGYVEQVFDSFAQSFDAKLEVLQYRAPELVAQAVARAIGDAGAAFDVVDLGCGTGLCGPLLKPWARTLAGCDLSVGMLRQARQRKVYDVLHKAELVYYLDTQPERFDIAVSADTLCYFGDLAQATQAAARALRHGGWLVYTVEALPDDATWPHRLQANGRYAHAGEHLRSTLADAGLQARAIEPVTLRQEGGQPVRGWLVSACKP